MDRSNLEYLYRKTVEQIFSSQDNYFRFLNFSSNLYKYSLEDQIVIHGQNPFAKAVATFSQWKGLERSINKGAMGITRFNAGTYGGTSSDLFDLSDTNGADHTLPNIWKFPPEIDTSDFFGMQTEEYVKTLISERLSGLENDSFARTVKLVEFIELSTCYTVLKRIYPADSTMTFSTERAFTSTDFSEFDILGKIDVLSSVATNAQIILRETERSVKNGLQQIYRANHRQSDLAPYNSKERSNLHTEPRNADLSPINRITTDRQILGEGRDLSENAMPQSIPTHDSGTTLNRDSDRDGQSVFSTGGDTGGEPENQNNGAEKLFGLGGLVGTDEQDSGGNLPERNVRGASELNAHGLTTSEYEIVKGALIDWDLYSQKSIGISAFFDAEIKLEKRIVYLQSIFGTANTSWGFDDRLTQVNTDGSGLFIKLAETSEYPNIAHHFNWNSVEVLISELTEISHRPADIESDRTSTPPFHSEVTTSQTSLFETSVATLPRELFLSEMLLQTSAFSKHTKFIEQGVSFEDFKKELKQFHGTSGGTINFSNGENGYYHYSPKNVQIDIRKAHNTTQTMTFSWNSVAKEIMELSRENLFSSNAEAPNKQTQTESSANSPTLKDLVTAPDTISVLSISQGSVQIQQVQEQRSGIEELIGCNLLGKAPYPNTDDTFYFYDLDWYHKELPATLMIDDDYICFGKVVIAKYINDILIEPTKDETDIWLIGQEKEQLFTNKQIIEKARGYAEQFNLKVNDYDLFALADKLNPSNRLRVLLVKEKGKPQEMFIENETTSFDNYLSPSPQYISLGDNVVAFVGTDKKVPINRYLNGLPLYGAFAISGIDDKGKFIDLINEQVSKYISLLETREITTDIVPYNIGDGVILDDGSEHVVDTITDSELVLRDNLNTNNLSHFPKEVFAGKVSITESLVVEATIEENSDIPKDEVPKYNYQYDYDGDFKLNARERFSDNITAIETLLKIEEENRAATPKEQAALSLYAGWGGISEAFDQNNISWSEEYAKLNDLLQDAEYTSARASVNSSFYTPLPVIKFIYSSLEKFGFTTGNILDPATGTGRFFGVLPEALTNSRLYGVELDSISARISAVLYPNANIYQSGYEHSQFSNNQFDVAVGNVPFGNYKVYDPQYNKHNFMIHDYFFAKTIDLVRTGGVIAYITSAGTLNKKTPDFREYLAERCDLIGVVRLPDNTFSSTGTQTTADVIFLQKRELLRSLEIERPDWVDTQIIHSYDYEKDGESITKDIHQNNYFVNLPHMVLGTTEIVSTPFGYDIACKPYEDNALGERLEAAISDMSAIIPEHIHDEEIEEAIPAPPEVKNFTFTKVADKIYYREHGLLIPQKLAGVSAKRMEGMLEIRDTIDKLVHMQTTVGAEQTLEALRKRLNKNYDSFTKDYGELNNQTNTRIFSKDIQCNLLLALEVKNKETGGYEKSDIFSKRTVDPRKTDFTIESASDALYVSINKYGRVNLLSMAEEYGKTCDDILLELNDVLYQNPTTWDENPYEGWETREEYLSGNIREKISVIEKLEEETSTRFARNLSALQENLPAWIEAGQIEVRLGAAWVNRQYFAQFMYETFNTPSWLQGDSHSAISIAYNSRTATWSIYNKTMEASVQAKEVFGTLRANAYEIMEDCLNLKDTKVSDRLPDGKYRLNTKETQLARAKQTVIKNAFQNWIFADTERRNILVEEYNNRFNAYRPRVYSGSHLSLPNLSINFTPYIHQKNATAHIVDSTVNTLLDHEVGAGKTATMIMGAYERIRMGLSKRALFAVPNHIVRDFSNEISRLYQNAKVMVVTERDFEKSKRQQFLNRIAFSDIEMIVIAHSQFEKIQMSPYHREEIMKQEIEELTTSISMMKKELGLRFSVKQGEKQRNDIEVRLKKLQNEMLKDIGNVTFEEMGVDLLLVDEADMFKNCYIFTKLQNVAGVGTAASQRAADMLMKCRYLNRNGGKIVFATGTVISNAVSELYVMQRYLQEEMLQKQGIYHFDEWVATYAETITSLEMAPEGNGYRQRTRLAKYFNIPELMQLYRTVADVQTEDTLDIETPTIVGGEPTIVLCPPSDDLLVWVDYGVKRCRAIRNREVEPEDDNMLKFTLEAKLAGLDMRLADPNSSFDPYGKLAECSNNILNHYSETQNEKGVQIVFCDISTPSTAKFNVYDDLKKLCVSKGINADEISFIHEAKTGKAKSLLFSRCRSGEIRLLIGSTEKCGAGTNIQDKLIAEHHLDCPYRQET